jgi:hypothetical protein
MIVPRRSEAKQPWPERAGRGRACRLGGIRGGTEAVRPHVRNRRGLPRGSGGCGREPSLTSGAATDEPPADLLGDVKLATSESSRPGDGVVGAAIVWSLRLEQPQHPLSAVRRSRRDDSPVAYAQRLRRPQWATSSHCHRAAKARGHLD